MIIEFQRAFTPASMGEEDCSFCGTPFPVESVLAQGLTEGRKDMGCVCPSCVEYFGRRNPERFPTLAEFAEAVAHYPEPVWGSEEEVTRLKTEDPEAYEDGYWATWVWQSPVRMSDEK